MANTTARGLGLLACGIVFTTVCGVFVTLRFVAARLVRREFYVDDGLVTFAFANALALGGVLVWAIFNGMGKHIVDTTPYELGIQFQLIVAAYVTWTLGTGAVKLSVLCLYMRIFRTRSFARYAYMLIALCVMFCAAFMAAFMTNCQPVSQMWKPVSWGHCRDMTHTELGSVSSSLVIDLAIIFLPMPWLWGLQMPLRNKIVVSVSFSIGFVTVGVMAWRIDLTLSSRSNPDFTYNLVDIALTSLLELWLGIVVACIPTLAPLLKRYIKPTLQKLSHYKVSGGSGGGGIGNLNNRPTLLAPASFHAMAGSKSKGSRSLYTELDGSQEDAVQPRHHHCDLEYHVSVSSPAAAAGFGPAASHVGTPDFRQSPDPNAIHVRHDIQMAYIQPRRT